MPSRVPSPVRPCATPPRFLYPLGAELQNSTASSTLSSAADNASTSRGSDPSQPPLSTTRPSFHQHSQPPNPNGRLMPMSTLSADVSGNKQQSLSGEFLKVSSSMNSFDCRRSSARAHPTTRRKEGTHEQSVISCVAGDRDRLLRCPARPRGQSADSAER